VQRFASELGWHGVVETEIPMTSEICGNLPVGTIVTCFTTTHVKHFLQVNQSTPGEFGKYRVAVAAERYNVRSTGFQACEFESIDQAVSEARRLRPLLERSRFRYARQRRQFLEQQPDELLPRGKKWRGWKASLRGRKRG
jgi:hypothetical protein